MKLVSVIIRVTLIAMIVVAPWFFGGVWAYTQWVLLLLAAVLLAADMLIRFGRYDSASWIPTTWLTLFLGIALGIWQLVPWSNNLASRFAPKSLELRNTLTTPAVFADGGLVGVGREASGNASPKPVFRERQTRSLYPPATREYLSLLALATAVCLLASSHAIDRRSILYAFSCVAICGAAFSFFGLIQRLSWNGKFYWLVDTVSGNLTSFGPYVNRNNAGGWLNMCLAAGLGLLITLHWQGDKPSSASGYRVRGSRRRGGSRPAESTHLRSAARTETRDERSMGSSLPRVPERPAAKTNEPGDFVDDALVARYAAMFSANETPSNDAQAADPSGSAAAPVESPGSGEVAAGDTKSEVPEVPVQPASKRSSSTGRRVKVRERIRVESTGRSEFAGRGSGGMVGSKYSVYAQRQPFVVRLSNFFSDYFASVNARKLWSVALVAFIASGVLCTASRGAIVAMLMASLITAIGLAARSGYRGYAVALLAILLAGTGLMGWAGQTEFVQSRLARLFDDDNLNTGRMPNWREALRTVPDNWTVGSGLGTYRYVYEPFQNRYLGETAHFHAENQYLQALVEGGVFALVLLILAIVFMIVCIMKLFRTGSVTDTSLAVMGTFALASQVVGGTFDFGLYIPANTLLMAMIAGVVVGRAALVATIGNVDQLEMRQHAGTEGSNQMGRQAHELESPSSASSHLAMIPRMAPVGSVTARRWVPAEATWMSKFPIVIPIPSLVIPALTGLLLVICMLASLEMHKTAKVESALAAAPLLQLREIERPAQIQPAMLRLQSALWQRPDDANAHQHLSELHQQMYRAKTYQRLVQEARKTGSEPAVAPADAQLTVAQRDDALWRRAATWHLHRTIRDLERESKTADIERLVQQPEVADHLLPALRHLIMARRYCPMIPHVHYALAELSVLPGAEPNEVVHLDRARMLSPADATLLYWSGVLELNSQRITTSCASWRQSLTLSPVHLDEIISSAKNFLTNRQVMEDVLPERADQLLHVARTYYADEKMATTRKKFLERAEASLSKTELPAEHQAIVAATIYRLLDRPEDARPYYEQAIKLLPDEFHIRYEFANMLYEISDFEVARDHAQYILDRRPTPAYRELREKIERAIVENTGAPL